MTVMSNTSTAHMEHWDTEHSGDGRELATGGNDSLIPPWKRYTHAWPPHSLTHARFERYAAKGGGTAGERVQEITNQLRVSGEMVRSLLRCFCQVRQEAFSRRTPLAISCLWRVMLRHDAQTSSSVQLCDR